MQEFTGSSEGFDGPRGSERQVSEFLRRGQRAYPEIKRRDKRLLEEALDFLLSAEGASDPEGTLKSLFQIYEEIDPYADYIKPGEREFFPKLKRERTLERFLEGFKYIYYILLRAQERLYLANAFGIFWERSEEIWKSEQVLENIRRRNEKEDRAQFAAAAGAQGYRTFRDSGTYITYM